MRNAVLITQHRYFGPLNYKIRMPQSTAKESRTPALLTCGLSVPSGLQHAPCNAQEFKGRLLKVDTKSQGSTSTGENKGLLNFPLLNREAEPPGNKVLSEDHAKPHRYNRN